MNKMIMIGSFVMIVQDLSMKISCVMFVNNVKISCYVKNAMN